MKERTTGRALVLGVALTMMVVLAACKGDPGAATPPAAPAPPQKVEPKKAEAPTEPVKAEVPEARRVEAPAAQPTPPAPTRPVNPLAPSRLATAEAHGAHDGHDHGAHGHEGHDHAPFDAATGRPLQRDAVAQAQPPEGVDAVKDFEGTKIALIHTANRVGEFDPCG